MTKPLERYRTPPKKAFRAMGLGQLVDGRIKVVAGYRFNWWSPLQNVTPLFVHARVLRDKRSGR
jgi:hypothetical protein